MKRLYLLLLALAASFTLLTACGNDTPDIQIPETPDISDASETPEASETESEITDGFAVVANGEAKFTLIRPENATDAELDLMLALRNFIKDKTGVTLEAKDDWIKKGQEHDASAFEILIGDTNYNETAAIKDATTDNNMTIAVQGNKLVLYSPVDMGYVTLAEQVEAIFASFVSGNSLVLPTDFQHTEKYVQRLEGLPPYGGQILQTHVIDSGDDNNLMILTGIRKEDYLDYLKELEAAGFTKYTEHEAAGNLFATYTDKDQLVNVYYMDKTRTIRIVEEPLSALPPKAEDAANYETVCTPAVRLVGNEFYPTSQDTSPTQNALCIIFRLSDGRLIVVDSGQTAQYSDHTENYLIQNLREMSPDPNNIRVAAWIMTHAHGDHTGGFVDLAKASTFGNGIVNLEHVIYNYETEKEYTYIDSETKEPYMDIGRVPTFASLSFSKPTEVITAHAGQVYHYADAIVEMLYTPEDFHPKTFHHHNTTSLVFRITLGGQTFMILGDISEEGCPIIVENYGDYLKSDFVQIAHHGYAGGIKSLYQAISAQVVLWPGGFCDFQHLHIHSRNKTPLAIATDLFVAGNIQHTLELPYTCTDNKQAAIDDALARRTVIEKEKMERNFGK